MIFHDIKHFFEKQDDFLKKMYTFATGLACLFNGGRVITSLDNAEMDCGKGTILCLAARNEVLMDVF